jgi:hypothetical protein
MARQDYLAFGGVRYTVGTFTTHYTFSGQKSDASERASIFESFEDANEGGAS